MGSKKNKAKKNSKVGSAGHMMPGMPMMNPKGKEMSMGMKTDMVSKKMKKMGNSGY